MAGRRNAHDSESGWRLPVNPELSRKEHAENVSKAWIIAMHSMDCVKSIRSFAEANPARFWEITFNRFPDALAQKMAPDLRIFLEPLPREEGPTPGVIASPLQSQISAHPLRLVVGTRAQFEEPLETIEAESVASVEETSQPEGRP